MILIFKQYQLFFRLSSFFFKAATLSQTSDKVPLFFGCLFNQKLRTTNRAFAIDGLVPGGKVAVGKAIAAIENFAAFGTAFHDFPCAAILRARHANGFAVAVCIQRLTVFAFRVAAAG